MTDPIIVICVHLENVLERLNAYGQTPSKQKDDDGLDLLEALELRIGRLPDVARVMLKHDPDWPPELRAEVGRLIRAAEAGNQQFRVNSSKVARRVQARRADGVLVITITGPIEP